LSAGESATFSTELVGGEHAGKTADVTVTVNSVRAKEVPDLDDEFAQTASEFDTLDELRADIRDRLQRVRLLEQGTSARDKVLEELLARTDVPLPESLVEAEVDWRRENMSQQLQSIGMSLDDYLATEERSTEDFDAELTKSATDAVKAQFILDAIARKEEIGVNEAELTEHIVRRSQSARMDPQEYANQIAQAGQLGALFSEVVRGKALALVLESAKVTDASGNAVDLSRLEADDVEGDVAGAVEGGTDEDDATDAADAPTGDETATEAAVESTDEGAGEPAADGEDRG
jgi:trigger factor